jgi:hypothetical protein
MAQGSWRMLAIAAAAALCGALSASPGWAANMQVIKASTPVLPEDNAVPTVIPGDDLAVACDALAKSNPDSDVRVVLTLAAGLGEDEPGYRKVLATNEQILQGAVRIRIPEVTSLENHTVDVDVYVVDDKGSHSCNAGKFKIALAN